MKHLYPKKIFSPIKRLPLLDESSNAQEPTRIGLLAPYSPPPPTRPLHGRPPGCWRRTQGAARKVGGSKITKWKTRNQSAIKSRSGGTREVRSCSLCYATRGLHTNLAPLFISITIFPRTPLRSGVNKFRLLKDESGECYYIVNGLVIFE